MSARHTTPAPITVCTDIEPAALEALLGEYGLQLQWVAAGETIPGSFWGEPEAGLIGNRLYVRPDTPVHSVLHEACHYICMPPGRRHGLHTNAGGDYDEENAVCYLQILLADSLPGLNSRQLMTDMDQWGYTFRLGSANAWFDRDAQEARQWLIEYGIVDREGRPTGRLRQDPSRAETGATHGL